MPTDNTPSTRTFKRTGTTGTTRLSVLIAQEVRTQLAHAAEQNRRSLSAELEVAALEHLANRAPTIMC